MTPMELWKTALNRVLRSWETTPYAPGQCRRGHGVDCVRFVDAVMCELHGLRLPELPRLPQDMSLHDREGAFRTAREIARRYPGDFTEGSEVEPGDVMVYRHGDAPGHVLIAGVRPGELWHATQMEGVHRTCLAEVEIFILMTWRPRERLTWR